MAPPPPFGRMASTLPNSATPNGRRRRRPTASRLPVDSAEAAQQPRDSQRTALRRPAALQPPADVVDTTRQLFDPPSGRRPHCRWLYPWRQHPRYRRLASRCCPAEQRLASCESNGAACSPQRLNMAMNRRRVFPERPRTGKRTLRGNISPLCIQNELVLARFARRVSEKPCKPPFWNAPREKLARKGRFSRPRPSNHT